MKTIIKGAILFITLVMLSVVNIHPSQAAVQFPDVPSDAWYKGDLEYIMNDSRQIFNGYPDGRFMPNETLTMGQFIKCVIMAVNAKVEPNTTDFWAAPYIYKAIELGYVNPNEFDNKGSDPFAIYKRPITRGEMSRIVSRAVPSITGAHAYRDSKQIKAKIKDYDNIPKELQQWVVISYDMGILGGFPDGTFKAENNLSRAEAVAVVRRMIDPEKRLVLDLAQSGTDVVVVDGITFDPVMDLAVIRGTNDTNMMSMDKVQDFAMLFYNKLKFIEKEGEYYCEGYIPNLPEGYYWGYNIQLEYTERIVEGGTREGFSPKSTIPNHKLPAKGESFSVRIKGTKHNLKSVVIPLYIYTIYRDTSAGNFVLVYSPNQKTLRKVDSYNSITTLVDFDVEGIFEW